MPGGTEQNNENLIKYSQTWQEFWSDSSWTWSSCKSIPIWLPNWIEFPSIISKFQSYFWQTGNT